MNKMTLTPKQEAFCNKYLECGDATQAYRFAYDTQRMADRTCNNKAAILRKHKKVAARIAELQAEQKGKSDITKDRVIEELAAILESKITDYVEFDGKTIIFKSFDELTERQVKAIESIKHGKFGVELKLHGKSWTIERICKMLGFDTPEKIEHSGIVNANISIVPLKKGKQTFASNEDEIDK